MSGWTALTIRFPGTLEDAVVGVLHEAGTLGVQAPVTAGGPDVYNSAIAYFEPGADPDQVKRTLERLGDVSVVRIERIADEEWVEHQEAARRPIEIGRRLTIVPRATDGGPAAPAARAKASAGRGPRIERRDPASRGHRLRGFDRSERAAAQAPGETSGRGARAEVVPRVPAGNAEEYGPSIPGRHTGGRIELVIPPQRAFGTGEHATTRLCLELIEELPLAGARVLDLGTGSGILAFAAAALGAHRVTGVDNDPEAIEIARENLAINAAALLPAQVDLSVAEADSLTGPFDWIVSNIYAGVLESLAGTIAALQPGRGGAVLSGFSPAEADHLASVYARVGYTPGRRVETPDWAAIHLVKHA